MRLCISGARSFAEIEFMTYKLNQLTFQIDDVILITNQHPGREWEATFPQADRWFEKKWANGWKGYKQRVRHFAPYDGEAMWKYGIHQMRVDMITDSDALVAFWDVGGGDFHTEELIRLAKVYDVKTRVFRV